MVKGITRQVILVKSPDPKLFEEAIFIVKEEALARELREELGVEVRVGRILDARRIADGTRDLLLLFYCAEIVAGEPRTLDCNAIAWAAPADLPRYDLATADRAVAERLTGMPPSDLPIR